LKLVRRRTERKEAIKKTDVNLGSLQRDDSGRSAIESVRR